MNRGYTLLWRKTWVNPLLCGPGKKYSRLEAWPYLINVLAAGLDDENAGLKRGERSIKSGVLSVQYENRRVDYNSTGEMLKLLQTMKDAVASSSSVSTSRTSYASFSKTRRQRFGDD